MEPEFADLRSAGRALGAVLMAADGAEPLVVAVIPNGVPVALGVCAEHDWPMVGLHVRRDSGVIEALDIPAVRGRVVFVVDDGVESGSVARAVAAPLHAAGARRVVLAVPACSHDRALELHDRYDDVIAVHLHDGDRSLSSFYGVFDTISEAVAEELLTT